MLRSTLATAALLATLGVPAFAATPAAQDRRDDHAQRQEERRVYDAPHRDYHTWSADEDRRYRDFVAEHHRKYRDFSRLNKRQQNEYWQWRHEHEHDDHR